MLIGGASVAGGSGVLLVQVTVPVLCVQLQVGPPLALMKVTPLGSASVTVIVAAAVEGPPLCTVSVYVMPLPATAVAGALLVIDRSAEALTVVSAQAWLFALLGSGVGELTSAQLCSVPPSLGAVTRMLIGGASVAGGSGVLLVQVTVPLPCVQLQVGPPLALMKVTPLGSASV